VSFDNRLTAEQLAALTPGDNVTIEIGADFSRRRMRTGKVVRLESANIVVSSKGPRGGTFIECYRRRDGVRVGGLGRAELIDGSGLSPLTTDQRRQTAQIDALYRDWMRNRSDVDRLRRLHAAIGESLESSTNA
jgi:hypothetical protein